MCVFPWKYIKQSPTYYYLFEMILTGYIEIRRTSPKRL